MCVRVPLKLLYKPVSYYCSLNVLNNAYYTVVLCCLMSVTVTRQYLQIFNLRKKYASNFVHFFNT